ncbi:hypothetical protein ACSU64_04310 [Bacillaceae bacterium C204]|uniref:hypothetical protein n=1 Tax=Neobacillus sp. 204 TaxID=3383351 RepID=UPI003977F1EA
MVYKNIEKFYLRKENERNRKRSLIRDQVIKSFFTVYLPQDIKTTIKASVKKDYLPTFSLRYKLRSSLEKVDETKYIELMNDEEGPYILVDFDFHNVKDDILNSSYYKQYKKQLRSDFIFKIDGRTEDGDITIDFYMSYGPFLSNFF